MQREPRKFTTHCIVFFFAILALFALLKWVSHVILQNQAKDTQLDIMMKRQILESPGFKNCMRHYEKNICVQYASEEEYMAIQRLKEQQRINMKALIERERFERNEQERRFGHLHSIIERSNESSSQGSLLMQSLEFSGPNESDAHPPRFNADVIGNKKPSSKCSSHSEKSSVRSNKSLKDPY